jgi:hypothetical protein
MDQRINGPPALLRPHVRQRRLNMGRVNASVERHAAMKAEHERDRELAFANIELQADRQKRGDEALARLADFVAALLCPEFNPISHELACRISGRANDQPREHDYEH